MGDRGGRARGDRGGGNRGDGGRGGRGDRGGRGGRGGGDGGQGRGRGGYQGEGRGGGRGGYQGEGRGGGRGGYQGEGRGGGRGGYQGEGRGGGRGGYQGEGRGGGFRGRGDRGGRGGRGAGRGNAPPRVHHPLPDAFPEPAGAITELENKLHELESKMASQSIEQAVIRLPGRPAFGTQGTEVKLWANYFTVDLKARNDLWVYNIEVKKLPPPPTESKGTPTKEGDSQSEPPRSAPPATVSGPQRAAAIAEACRLIKHGNAKIALATELKAKLVATGPINLPDNSMQIEVEKCTFVVSLEGGHSINLGQMMRYLQDMRDDDSTCPKFEGAVDALNVVLSHTARNDASISAIGSKRFFLTGGTSGGPSEDTKPENLFHDLIGICRGYFQSLRLSTGRLLLNTNVTYGVFRLYGKLDDIFARASIDRRRRDRTFEMMAKYLSRARVEIKFQEADSSKGEWTTVRRTMTGIVQSGAKVTGKDIRIVKEQHPPGPGQVEFHDGSGYVSVMDHYKKKYGVTLNPNWPLLNTGTMDRPRFVPAEFLTVLPTAIKTKLNDADSDAMIRFACRPPGDNYHYIKNYGRALLHHESHLLQHFGLEVKPDLITVHGRELSIPTIQYLGTNSAKVQPKSGGWNMVQKKFASSPQQPIRWGCVAMLSANYASDDRVNEVASAFRNHVNNNCGLPMEPAPVSGIVRCDDRWDEKRIRKTLETQLAPHKPQITLVFLNKDTVVYGNIKRVCDVHLGLHTVCMDWRKASPAKPAYFGNVALKWNLKAVGANHYLVDRVGLIKEGKAMFVGYDVTHPTNVPKGADASDPASCSIVGLVASVDKHLNQWPATAWVQPGGMEVCEDDQLRTAFESRLKLWFSKNKAYPEKIIIYRDGVSEGQFTQVLEKELPRIREACRKMYPAKQQQPQLAIIVSVKRHHTRFYPTTREKSSKSGNILPGTVVDRGVTQSRYWDFFLTAHECLQGTARPAHYTVLLDEIFRARRGGRPADDLETITHDLCYMFGRATRAVSICPPAYYADIVCERVRIHRGALPDSGKGPWKVHERLKDEMYYV